MNSATGPAFHRPRLYSAAQVRTLDRRAIEQSGIPGYTLMQRAAHGAFERIRTQWPQAGRFVVLCGPGNNGGDGYELARLLRADGRQVRVLAVGALPARGDAVQAHAAWCGDGGEVTCFEAQAADAAFADAEVLVDALFGIGIDRPVIGDAAEAIARLNARRDDQRVIALDLPSGLDADCGKVHGIAVRADLTLSFIGRKLGAYLDAGPDHAGLREHDDLGLSSALLATEPGLAALLQADDLRRFLPRRAADAHKGRHGHVLVVGGERGMAGAVLLAARGALRAGAGLVSVATREAHAAALTAAQPELMVHGVESAGALRALMARADVLAIGPGLGQGDWARTLLAAAMEGGQARVIDADALNLLTLDGAWPLPADAIITPHPGEAARILGTDTAAVQAERLDAVRALQRRTGAVSVLKGAGSLVVGPDGAPNLCPYGNPAMGVGGMGDVLTGVIAALRAQGLDTRQAAELGVLAHALAGDAAAAGRRRGLIPSDLLDPLPAILSP